MPEGPRKPRNKDLKKRKKRLPKTLSGKELEALLTAPSPASMTGRRATALMTLMGRQGLRVSEACNLKMSDLRLDDDDPHIRVIGKGDKERRAFIGPKVIAVLDAWIELRPRAAGPFLFPVLRSGPKGFGGTAKRGNAVSPRATSNTVRCYAIKAKIRRHVHPHMLRHTFATQALRKGIDIRTLQEMMGHEWMSTTAIYLQVAGSDMAAAARRLEE